MSAFLLIRHSKYSAIFFGDFAHWETLVFLGLSLKDISSIGMIIIILPKINAFTKGLFLILNQTFFVVKLDI